MGLFDFFKEVSGNIKNTKIYGPPIEYLSKIDDGLKNIAISNRILLQNPGRLHKEYEFHTFTIKIDYIYFSDYIQVSIKVSKPNLGTEVFKCKYDVNEIRNLVFNSVIYIENKTKHNF